VPASPAAGGPGASQPPPGTAPIYYRVPTNDKVAFITIDDGYSRSEQSVAMVRRLGVPVSLFLISHVAADDPAYFKRLEDLGAKVEAHTLDHANMKGMPYERQKQEICGSADKLKELFGRRPELFRPPFGNFDQTTLRAAHDCGMKAVMHWRATVDGGAVQYQSPTRKLHPGDVVLMHFRPNFVNDLQAAVRAIRASGLTPALLENYV
jgi:peptidoglycan/xylan/chitin deacetylase (PgdA/CDA1 family)